MFMKFWKYLYNSVYYLALLVMGAAAALLLVSYFPAAGNIKVLTVLSGSMEPKIHTGSLVVIKPEPHYRTGDVVTFGAISKTETPTTHRIIKTETQNGREVFTTRGDANNADDMKQITAGDIDGKALFSIPWAGYAVSAAKKPAGFFLLVIVPAVIVVYDELQKIGREIIKLKGGKKEAASPKETNKEKTE